MTHEQLLQEFIKVLSEKISDYERWAVEYRAKAEALTQALSDLNAILEKLNIQK